MNKKSLKYLIKYGERNYAPRERKLEKNDLKKHSDRSSCWQTSEASSSDCLQCSKESEKEVTNQSSGNSGKVDYSLMEYGRHVILTEEVVYPGEEDESLREENVIKAHQEGRQGISFSDQRRCEVEETNHLKIKGEKMKKQSLKEKKHEARETKAYEKKEDKKENAAKAKAKKNA